eukprot:7181119-Alexandrium_andersonii.AAC.1
MSASSRTWGAPRVPRGATPWVYDWLAHNIGTKGLIDLLSFLVVLDPQIVRELSHSKLGYELAEMCVDSLVENERSAVDDCGVVTQGRPLTAPAPFLDDDSNAGGRRF